MTENIHSNQDSVKLLELIEQEDRKAFLAFFDYHSALTYSLALRMLGNTKDASDLIYEIYTHIWKKSLRYSSSQRSPEAWLTMLIRRRAILKARSSRLNQQGFSNLQTQESQWKKIVTHHKTEKFSDKDFANDLDPKKREILELSYYDGFTIYEISKKLNLAIKDVHKTAQEALQILRKKLGHSKAYESLEQSNPRWLLLAELYALDLLEEKDLEDLENDLLRGDHASEEIIHETRDLMTLFAKNLELQEAPSNIRETLADKTRPPVKVEEVKEVIEKKKPKTTSELLSIWRLFGIVLVCLCIVLVVDILILSKQKPGLKMMPSVVTDEGTHYEHEQVYRLVSSSNSTVAKLRGLDPTPDSEAEVIWDPVVRSGYIHAKGLPVLAPGFIYELWAIGPSGPMPAGLFTVEENGTAFVRMPILPAYIRIEKFAVTIERVGGSPEPTGEMVLVGSV